MSLGLVPVIYTSQDNVYFLDGMGGGWGQDLISGNDAFRTAMNGDELFASFILYARFNRDRKRRRQLEGARGAEIGRKLGAAPIAVASRVDQWWGSPDVLILETTTRASWLLDPAEVNAAPRNTFVAVLSSASDAALNTIK